MSNKTLTKHRFIIKLISILLLISFLVSTITGIAENYLLMKIQGLNYLIFSVLFILFDYSLNKWETFPEYFNEYGFVKLLSFMHAGVVIPAVLYIPYFFESLIYSLPDTYRPDLLPVVLTNILLSVAALYAKSFIYYRNNNLYDELYGTIVRYLSKLFYLSFIFLVFHAIIIYFQLSLFSSYIFIVNIVAVVVSFIMLAFESLEKFRVSVKEIVNDNVSEEKRFEFLSFIAENIEYFCEFKRFKIRKLKDRYKAEIYVVLPAEYSIETLDKLEMKLNENAGKFNHDWVIKLYSKPCRFDCIKDGETQCPVKKIQIEN